jgi:hypothetical protein
MRHRKDNPSWRRRIRCIFGSTMVAATFAVTLGAWSQDSTPPPPPPDQDQTQSAAPQSNVRAVRLSDVEGKVQIFNGTSTTFDQAQPNMPVVEGMKLVTADDGRAEIQFEDGSVARVTPNSSVTFNQLHRTGDGATVTLIDVNSGLTYYELNGRGGQYTVRFGPNSVSPVDSSIFRINLDGNPAELAVTHGTVHVQDSQNLSLDVHTNQSIHFDTQNPGTYEVIQSVSADSWDQWNSDRDQALATLETDSTTARASSGNPDDPGWNDLDYYGDWYNVPGYGMAWGPSGVGQNWDPFGAGYWGYYPTFGYTWISSYSWGWWPYHCGAWNWFDTHGWLWFPGNCGWGAFGGGWYPYTTVWRVPPGYKPPVRPIHGRGPGPFPRPQPLVAVNRGTQFTQQFRAFGQPKPAPRIFDYDGKSIAPAEATIHTRQTGPIGEGFTASAIRTHPEVFDRPLSVSPGTRTSYQPGSHGYVQPPSYPVRSSVGAGAVGSRGSYAAGSGGGVHYSAPAAAPHASAPAASGGGGAHVH